MMCSVHTQWHRHRESSDFNWPLAQLEWNHTGHGSYQPEFASGTRSHNFNSKWNGISESFDIHSAFTSNLNFNFTGRYGDCSASGQIPGGGRAHAGGELLSSVYRDRS